MWNHKVDLLLFLSRLWTFQTHQTQQKQHPVELTMDLVPMASSLSLLARIHYEHQNVEHKLRVAAFSDPPVCCFCQKCVKLNYTQ